MMPTSNAPDLSEKEADRQCQPLPLSHLLPFWLEQLYAKKSNQKPTNPMGTKVFNTIEIREIGRRLQDFKDSNDPRYLLLDHSDFKKLFNISSRTSLYWRTKGLIPYYRIGFKLFFKIEDVETFLNKHLKTN